jgi:hypothetical protein
MYPKHVEAIDHNKQKINSASCWSYYYEVTRQGAVAEPFFYIDIIAPHVSVTEIHTTCISNVLHSSCANKYGMER